jgi:hypothetical protein
MACFHPLEAVQEYPGAVPRISDGAHDRLDGEKLWLPCGRCIGCRLVRQRAWAIRCMHEAQMHRDNSFVTLTYNDTGPSLNYFDFQKFVRALRKGTGVKFRYFVGGEYGGISLRPHFHALLFGIGFSVDRLHSSSLISKYWRHGFNYVGDVTYDSASYVARYCCDKVNGDRASAYYLRVDTRTGEYVRCTPEFGRMSLKPHGLGYSWFQKYWKEVFLVRDGVVLRGGRQVPSPRYYFDLLCRLPEDAKGEVSERVEFDRYVRSARFSEDCTPARLEVRERCARAKMSFLRRDTL